VSYLAHDTKLDRDVAIAVLRPKASIKPASDRIRLEARAMARLGTIRDCHRPRYRRRRRKPYIVSQYVAGGTVRGFCPRTSADACLPVEDVLRIADDNLPRARARHSHGIVHRDLKPANVWLSSDGLAMLGDFGLAVSADQPGLIAGRDAGATANGMMIGTVRYMSPEQALGKL